MTLKKLFLLSLVLLGMLLYLYAVEFPREGEKLKAAKLFEGISKEAIKTIEVKNKDGEFTLINSHVSSPSDINKASGSLNGKPADSDAKPLAAWQLSDLKDSDLDFGSLNALLTGVTDLLLESPIPENELEKDLAVYGLASPEVTLKISVGDKAEEVQLGKKNDYVGKRYAKASLHPGVYLVSDDLFSAASKSKTDFRNKTPIQFADSDLASMSVARGADVLKFIAGDSHRWRLAEPIKARANENEVANLARSVRNSRVSEFLDGADAKLAEYGLDKPDLVVTLAYKDALKKDPLVISLKKEAEKAPEKKDPKKKEQAPKPQQGVYLYVKGRPLVYKLPVDPISGNVKSAEAYREKQYLKFPTEKAVEFELSGSSAASAKGIKSGADWKVNGKDGDGTFIYEFLKSVSDLEATAFPNEERDYGFGSPAVKVVVKFGQKGTEAADAPRTLVVGLPVDDKNPESAGYYAAVDDLSEPFIISKDSLRKISPKEEMLVKAAKVEGSPTPTPNSAPAQ